MVATSRVIKFRAWHIGTGTMTYKPLTIAGFVDHHHENDRLINNLFNSDAQKWQILMQFTGLLDKNGKEIYESDLVRIPYNDEFLIREVKWSNDKIGFTNVSDSYEVIGNRFEHPNLLQKEKK
jgi:uncharacterized phage protein (TIGR01671 family)